MKLKLLLAVLGAAVLLGAFVSSASARNLSLSSQTSTILWRSWEFSGGWGTQECDVKLSGSFHTRAISKSVGSLIGYVTEGSVLRCSIGSMTINQASLPWHRRYSGYAGTLPNVTGIAETFTGVEFTFRESIFGFTCTVRRETSSTIGTYGVGAGGTITRADVSGTSPCGSFTGSLSGTETNVTNGSSARITVTLI